MDIDKALRQTLEDLKVSRKEKSKLKSIFSETNLSDDVIRARAFDLARSEMEEQKGSEGLVIDWLEEVVKALDHATDTKENKFTSRACFSPKDNCWQTICQLFQYSKKTVDVCVFTITDNRISDAMLEAQRRGVKIRVISDNDKSFDLGSDINVFERVGIEVITDKTDAHMHHKFAIFDGILLLTGSYNWTRSAAIVNQENIALIGDAKLIRNYESEFDHLWKTLA